MASKSRAKGDYHERSFVKWLQKLGFKAKRQPLSGALGGEYTGDILWRIKEGKHKTLIIFDGDVFEEKIAPLLQENYNGILTNGEGNQVRDT